MFSNLGLFARVTCPDSGCVRSRCIFNHSTTPNHPSIADTERLPKKSRPSLVSPPHARQADSRPKSVTERRGSLSTLSGPYRGDATAVTVCLIKDRMCKLTPLKLAPRPSSTSTFPVFPRTSPQPAPDRQKALRTLLDQFEKLVSSSPRQC